MARYICFAALIMAIFGCNADKGAQQLETAIFEEKQNNREHAVKLYEEVIARHPDSPNAKIARERLDKLKGSK